jgi:hypothetical protein
MRFLRRRSNKYNARKVSSDGHDFDSRIESRRYAYLRLRQAAAEISNLTPHPPTVFLSEAHVPYAPDFYYVEDGLECWEDVKGAATRGGRWPTIKLLWKSYGPGRLVEVTHGRAGWICKPIDSRFSA